MRVIESDQYKRLVLSVMIHIDNICRKHNLDYFIYYGSLIGAMRHKGFIPWDDDIDIIMPRKDYDQLRYLINNDSSMYRFIDCKSSKDTIYAFGKVSDSRTKVVDKHFRDVDGYGAFVDIFPLDYFNNSINDRIKLKLSQVYSILRATSARKKPGTDLHGFKRIKGWIAFLLSSPNTTRFFLNKIDYLQRSLNDSVKNTYCVLPYKYTYPHDALYPPREYEFEGYMFLGPNMADYLLKIEYGDYMKMPPENQRTPHSIDCYWVD